MGGVQDTTSQPLVLGVHQILAHAPHEVIAKGHDARGQLLEHPVGQGAVVLGVFLDAVKDRRLDVRDDQPVKIVEDPPLDDRLAQSPFAGHVHVAGVE